MNDSPIELDLTDEDTLFYDEVSDEALEAAASNTGMADGVASYPFTYVSGICC